MSESCKNLNQCSRQSFEIIINDLEHRLKAAEKEIRAKIVKELRSSAFLDCDVNKEHVLLCILHGTTLDKVLDDD